MLTLPISPAFQERGETCLTQGELAAELEFYQTYDWCLNPHLTVAAAIDHLRDEVNRLGVVPSDWRLEEVATNVFLLSSGLLNCADEYLRGPALCLPSKVTAMPFARHAVRAVDLILNESSKWRRGRVRQWRESWLSSLNDFLSLMATRRPLDASSLAKSGAKLAALTQSPLLSDLQTKRLTIPSPFSRLDMTHNDVLSLGECFADRFPDRTNSILLVGLRTSGSYFAPLLRAFLENIGYETVSVMTVEPKKGAGHWENKELERFARQGYLALIVDDPPATGGAILAALDMARHAGFSSSKAKVLVPVQSSKPEWIKAIPELVVSLEPERWQKHSLLEPQAVERQLKEYFASRNLRVSVVASPRAEQFNTCLQNVVKDHRSSRLKRIFEVELTTPEGKTETCYVLAKSVGWGWLGYHAFLIGRGLSTFVPTMLGLRNGILFMEWIPQDASDSDSEARSELLTASSSYIAARVRGLKLETGSVSAMDLNHRNNGIRVLAKALSRAYGALLTDTLMRSRLHKALRQLPCPCPTHIDGKMQRAEWVAGPRGWLKTDYEHHGMGKSVLNVVDPAYDLADTILNLQLSLEEERNLITKYVGQSGDAGVGQRLFTNKLLAGFWTMVHAQEQLFAAAHGPEAQQEIHQQFMNAWNFLTIQTARHCGGLYQLPADLNWRAPLVALDIDGVIDRRMFGFPSTTAAGIEALSVLHAHGISIALNTARSAAEVRDYCQAYSLAGGIAEHGGYLWDAVRQRGRVLISEEAVRQLDELRKSLRRIPGVFLDDRHQYSVRAFTYQDKPQGLAARLVRSLRSAEIGDGALAPLPGLFVQHLMTTLGLDRLCFHQTTIDTTFVARENDKGTGLSALRDWVLGRDAETIAVGDHAADLPAFQVATRSFAPSNIGCAQQARLLGCQIVSQPYQQGLLQIARSVVHADGKKCKNCADRDARSPFIPDLFMDLLQAADRGWPSNLLRALLDPGALKLFMR
jgi:hydroxymethylpyrimidine pyrophosphatase-like HAD family hydrolase